MVNKKPNKFKNKNNISLINFSQCDYSTSLLEKKRGTNKKNKKRYIVYLETPPPYLSGDLLYDGKKPAKNSVEMWYNELNSFFDYIENLFKASVIIIPHNKYKIPRLKKKNFNPYFKKRVSDNSYNACEKIIPGCLFIVNKGSSALAHAITHYKPIQNIYSSNYLYEEHQMKDLYLHSNLSGGKIINTASINKKKLINNLKVNKKIYNLYKYKYLTYKNLKPMKFNHEILRDLLDGISLKN